MTLLGPKELRQLAGTIGEVLKQTFPNRINNTVIHFACNLADDRHPGVRVKWVLFNPDEPALCKTFEMYVVLPEFGYDNLEEGIRRIVQFKLNDVLLQLTKGIIAKDLTSLVDNLNEWDT